MTKVFFKFQSLMFNNKKEFLCSPQQIFFLRYSSSKNKNVVVNNSLDQEGDSFNDVENLEEAESFDFRSTLKENKIFNNLDNQIEKNNLKFLKVGSNKSQLPKNELAPYRPVIIGEAGVQFAFSQLLGANLHLGHRSIAIDPRGMENMLGLRNDFYVINLLKSIQPLKSALHVLSVVVAKRGKALFTNLDKRLLFNLIGHTLSFCFRYVFTARKWPGVLTNFIYIRHREPTLRVSFQVPSYAYAVRRYDHHLAAEANILNIPSMTVYDSDTNPLASAFYPVSANDETLTSRSLFARLFFRSIHDGHQKFLAGWIRKRTFFLTDFFSSFYYLYYRYRLGSFLYENFFRNQFLALFSPSNPFSFSSGIGSDSSRLYRLHLKLLLLDSVKSWIMSDSAKYDLKPIFFSSFRFCHFGFLDSFGGINFSSMEARGPYFSAIGAVNSHAEYWLPKIDNTGIQFQNRSDSLWQSLKLITLGFALVNCRADRFGFIGFNADSRSIKIFKTCRLKLINYLRLRSFLQTKLFYRYRTILARQWKSRLLSPEDIKLKQASLSEKSNFLD